MVLAADDFLPPGLIIKIPFDCFLDAVLEFGFGEPAELGVNLGRVDCVAQVVALAVGYVCNEALGFAELLADELYDVDVRHLVVTADVVDLADSALVDDEVNRLAVVLDIEPVAHVLALSVDRQRLVRERVRNHKRNELLGEVVGTVVVGAAADCDGEPVGSVIGEDEQIRASLRRAVRARGVNRSFLGEEKVGTVERKVAVDLVGADLMIALNSVLPARVHKHLSAENVCREEDFGVLNRAVNVALSREIHDHIGLFFLEKLVYRLAVCDALLDKAEIRVVHNWCERREVARVGQAVEADNPVVGIFFEHMKYEVRADKARSAGNDDGHFILLCCLSICRRGRP